MSHRFFFLAALTAAVSCLTSCAADEPDPASIFDDITLVDGSADVAGLQITTAHLGDSFEALHVDAMPPGGAGTDEAIARAMKVFRIELQAGQNLTVVMRRNLIGDVDPFLLLKDPDGETIARGEDQAALPMADEVDALITLTVRATGTHYLFASSKDMGSTGDFSLDLLELTTLPANYNLGLTNPAVRAYARELRNLQVDVDRYVVSGFFIEGEDALLLEGERPEDMALREVAEARSLRDVVNGHRTRLIEEFITANTGESDQPEPDAVAQLAPAFVQLWAAM